MKAPLASLALLSAFTVSAAEYKIHQFTKTQLDIHFWAEGATFGDFNRDGKMDIVSGPYWYAGPDFKQRHEYYPATRTFKLKPADGSEQDVPGFEGSLGKNNAYSDNFFAYAYDFNGDGWEDILILGFPGAESAWYENPQGRAGHWKKHVIFRVTDNESPMFADLTGDGRPELISGTSRETGPNQRVGQIGYARPDGSDPTKPWTFHAITPELPRFQRFTHGLGIGDVNGDGRLDILEKNGWWEQPASLAGDPVWKFHEFMFSPGGGAQMFAYDVNGDGLNDVITSLAGHGYGLAWYEQVREGDQITFKAHTFMNKELDENKYGVAFSQLHAIDLVDMDGDGLKDIITGKRFWAHGATGDPEPNAPAVIYWFKLVREPGGGVDWVPHLIDNDSGVGTQVVAKDITGDGHPEIVVSNKKGTFFHAHTVKKVSKADWEKAQPKPYVKPPDAAAKGIVPTANGGRELNLSFENGDLRDWTAEGNAFQGQPVKGDTVAPRRSDMKSRHHGQYWIGTFEKGGDDLTGTLTSAAFKVSHPWASFLVAGGDWEKTRVELVRADTGKAFFAARGNQTEDLRPVVVDLKEHVGKDMFIRIVDQQQGHWGHINFDDFRFFAQRPTLANELSVAELKQQELPDIDAVKYAGLPADRAAELAELPPGFKMHAFAAEPDIAQPIAFCLDDRGRVWVAEGHNYPKKGAPGQGKDRILVFEDTNGDHKFNRRTVFMEGLNLVSGLEVGFGGVWVGAAPELLFIPVNDWENPKPAGEPRVLLDGWDEKVDTHETLNTFMWGPDGWLYGVHGVFCPSHVGKPGTPKEDRQRVDAAVWRYHPQKHEFEVFAEGTSNPWGIDFNEYGHFFIEACVIPHFWHVIQGARYQRQGGQHFAITVEEMKRVQKHLAPTAPQYINPFIYDDIKSHGDHVHYAGTKGPHAANNRSDEAGGGHAHAGLMIYLGGSWPDEYRGKAFMNNIHGQRLNVDIPVRAGSGYVGQHGPDFLNFQDRWSQVLNMLYDQDGSMFMIDWYDANQCHHNRMDGHDRSNGRIYKVVYNDQPVTRIDLQKKSNAELVELHLSKNDFLARHARRLLQERGGDAATTAGLQKILRENTDVTKQLRALWSLHATRKLAEADLLGLLAHSSEHLRSWAIQLLCEDRRPGSPALREFARLAREDSSPMVRLYLAAAMQRTPIEQRLPVLQALVAKGGDAGDHNLPLMYWYAMEPVVGDVSGAGLELLTSSQIPVLRQYITRRLTTESLAGAR